MARKFQIKRGLKANLPTLAQGEFAMTTNSGAEGLFLGNGTKNLEIPILKNGELSARTLVTRSGKYTGISEVSDDYFRVVLFNDDIGLRGGIVIRPDQITFTDSDYIDHTVVHSGNIGRFLGVASASVE